MKKTLFFFSSLLSLYYVFPRKTPHAAPRKEPVLEKQTDPLLTPPTWIPLDPPHPKALAASKQYGDLKKQVNDFGKKEALLLEYSAEPYLSILSQSLMDGKEHPSSPEQALLRLFAIDVLGFQAKKQGDFQKIEQVIQALNQHVKEGSGQKGAEHDLVDLVDLWIQALEPDQLYQDPELFVSRLAYTKELRSYYGKALHYAFPNTYDSPEMMERFLPVLKS